MLDAGITTTDDNKGTDELEAWRTLDEAAGLVDELVDDARDDELND